jgi:hypothetical protein
VNPGTFHLKLEKMTEYKLVIVGGGGVGSFEWNYGAARLGPHTLASTFLPQQKSNSHQLSRTHKGKSALTLQFIQGHFVRHLTLFGVPCVSFSLKRWSDTSPIA